MPEKLKALERVKDLVLEITASEDERVIKGIASTSSRDRDDDRLMVDEWKLDTYKTNPVFLWGHDSFEPAIATVRDIKVEGGKLLFEALFPTEGTYKKADEIYGLYKQGILKTFSVRFRSTDYKQNEFGGYDFKELELLEISAVNIPANPDAVVTEVKKLKDIEGNKNNSQEGEKDMDEKTLAMIEEMKAKMEKMEADAAEKEKKAAEAKATAEKQALESENAEMKKSLEEMKTKMEELEKAQKEDEKSIGKLKSAPAVIEKHDDSTRVRDFFKAIKSRDYEALQPEKGLSEGVDSDGGYFVPNEFRNEVLQIMVQGGIARREGTVLPMGEEKLEVPEITSKPDGFWVSETEVISEGQPGIGQLVLTAKLHGIIIPMTNQLLRDSKIPLQPLLGRIFAEKFGQAEDYQAFNGDGTVFTGILNNSNVQTVTMGSGDTAFTNISLGDLFDVMAAVPSTTMAFSKWFMSRTAWAAIKNLKSGDSYVFNPSEMTLLGYPVVFVDQMPTTSAADTVMLGFGDMRNIYFGDRETMSVMLADQATVGGVNLYERNMLAMRATERVAISIALGETFAILKTSAS